MKARPVGWERAVRGVWKASKEQLWLQAVNQQLGHLYKSTEKPFVPRAL